MDQQQQQHVQRAELEPFPLRGISVAHLEELQEEINNAFVKISVRCEGKREIGDRPLGRLLERLGTMLTGGSRLGVAHYQVVPAPGEREALSITAIIATKTPQPLSEIQNSSRIRDTLKTQVLRQSCARKLGEEAELVPFAGFTSLEISTELELTTHEVCEVFVKPRTLTTSGKNATTTSSSYVDTLDQTNNAGTYVMHCWSDPFCSVVSSLGEECKDEADKEGMFVWLDLFSLNQHARYAYSPGWLTSTFCDALGQIGSALLVLPNWQQPTVLSRAWVVWELLACVQQGMELNVCMPKEKRVTFDHALFADLPFLIRQCFNQLDAQNSLGNDAHAQQQILNCIRDSVGFQGANLVVKDRLLEWLAVVSEQTSRNPAITKDLLATSTFCFSLAKILSVAQGKHAEAEQMLKKAVDIRTVELGADHDLTTEAQIALANVFRVQGKSAEAEVTLRRVCEARSKTKGDAHDDTLLALATLGRVLVDRGNFEEAEELCRDNLALLLEKPQGVNDKRTLETLVTLSQLADLRADSELAAKHLRTALPGYVALYGAEAAQTLNCQVDLAGFLAELENFDEAEEMFRNAAEKLAVLLGNAHEWTIKAVTGLGVLLKVRESLGPNYTPGQFMNAAAASSVFEQHQQEQQQPPTHDPGLDTAINSIRSTRHTRHEKIKQPAAAANAGGGAGGGKANARAAGPASRKHLRGWLDKLPIEISQRERERQLRLNASAPAHHHGHPPSPNAATASEAKPKSMLFKMMSGMGSTKFVVDKAVNVVTRRSLTVPADANAGGKLQWERRFFQLQSNQKHSSMVYWLTDDDCRNGRDARDHFDLDDYTSRIFETSPFGELCFSITGPKGRLHLRAQTPESKAEWIAVFKSALAFRGAADKAALFTNGEISPNSADFSASFVNMESLLQAQHSTVLSSTGTDGTGANEGFAEEESEAQAAPPVVAMPEGGVSQLLKSDMAGVSFD